MTVSRRDVLRGAGAVAGLQFLPPLLAAPAAWGEVDPAATARRRLVVVDLTGGNDGLNTVVPVSGTRRQVYEQVRPMLRLDPATLRSLDRNGDDGALGLHPELATLHALYAQDRLAIVQGVDYPQHNYSHFVSHDIWHSGEPDGAPDSGWLGRHLDRVGVPSGELRAVGIGGSLPLALRGTAHLGAQVNSLGEVHFSDGTGAVAANRHLAFRRYAQHSGAEPKRQYYGEMCAATVALDEATRGLSAAAPGGVANLMLTARALLAADLGVEVVVITIGGYDTHDTQLSRHVNLLRDLDQGIEAFFYGTKGGVPVTTGGTAGNGLPDPIGTPPIGGTPIGPIDPELAARTLVMTISEFGRRIGENATGTDHGAAAPLFLVGPPPPAPGSALPRLVPGLHGDHPDVGTPALPKDNLAQTTDLRSVYQAVLTRWINDPDGAAPDEGDPLFVRSGTDLEADGSLAGLFTTA